MKYEGYIARQQDEIEKQQRNENTLLPEMLDYRQVTGLSNEVIAKLNDHKPVSIGQGIPYLRRHACSDFDPAGLAEKAGHAAPQRVMPRTLPGGTALTGPDEPVGRVSEAPPAT